ncbi:hypothetical protein PVL29_018537 [Vitis rotundifolia]|uniref:Uncharacterized protein n=1 Tax=Vitis rotundifolia TaxID=103349 RepID=A0AA38Z5W2_VITRO|nr:hypothetical protein PVL29_018537 [Vitis rotundifolia]
MVVHDLFLVENQLPFGVLKLIFEGTSLSVEEMIKKFENKEPSHLLDLFQSALLGRYKKIQPKQDQKPEEKENSSLCGGGDEGFCCPWKKGKQQGQGIWQSEQKEKSSLCGGEDGGFCCPWKNGKQQGIWKSFGHIKELKAAGIYFRPSRTSSLTDISFKSYFFYGHLKLPSDDYAVTSYIYFLYELIDQADDVKELRSKHILYNFLGSDEDVAQIFNEITNNVEDTKVYEDVKARIQEHYNKRVNTWITQVLHDHFRSPWTFMALTAAVWMLILTGLQTYYAHPGKHIIHTYMWLFGVPSFLFVVWYIVRPLWD